MNSIGVDESAVAAATAAGGKKYYAVHHMYMQRYVFREHRPCVLAGVDMAAGLE